MKSGDEMLRQIVDKSAVDAEFRQQLLSRSQECHNR